MKLSQIRSFVAVARCGKFSQAAIELDLTQPTVSHAIASLESELGIQLLLRGKKGITGILWNDTKVLPQPRPIKKQPYMQRDLSKCFTISHL